MEMNASNTNRHKLMAMGLPIKAKKGGAIMKKASGGGVGGMGSGGKTAPAAKGTALKDREGRALAAGKMKGNLTMIAPQTAMKKGGSVVKKMKEGGKADMGQDKSMIKKAFKQHDMQEHKGGKGTKLALKKGGMAKRSKC
jgi:hypothetical protein